MNLDELRRDYDIVPIARELSADALTPVAAFAALSGDANDAFLFESVERGENLGRYSFVGFDPRRTLRFDRTTPDPAGLLKEELRPLRVYNEDQLPPFCGGAVGFFGHGVAGWTERIPDSHADDLNIPDARLLFFDNVAVFDHVKQRLYLVSNIFTKDPDASLAEAEARLDRAVMKLRSATVDLFGMPADVEQVELRSNFERPDFEAMIREAKEEIAAGEIYQIVLSQRWETPYPTAEALTLYRTLRSVNPSPYMFLLRTAECTLVGASPEMLVRVEDGIAETRPIAGTRWRGATPEEDAQLEAALLADPKENAEHLMLVDLGRNDLGRVSKSGSVAVSKFCYVERYSHVMHLVTDVLGKLRDDRTSVDAFLSCFPAGTLTGAPKIRAMELIDRFEKSRRGPYGGAVAYFGFSGNLDSCITIRTAVLAHDRAFVQAGGGIVYDSDPAYEYHECVNKAAALRKAISLAKAMLARPRSGPAGSRTYGATRRP
ncbi:MAG TPA: anthranilate synthase component I [Thermoanaerobaculia bacterium]|nr:anthranilate synthase component I [Thermoanaerobaculia bacterium]